MRRLGCLIVVMLVAGGAGCDGDRQVVRVKDRAGNPIEQARVQFNIDSSPVNPVVFTDKQGIAVNPKERFGTSYVTVKKKGYKDEQFNAGKKWPVDVIMEKDE